MRKHKYFSKILALAFGLTTAVMAAENPGALNIGWATEDITPDRPAILGGMPWARISDGVMDPLTVTALALETDYPDGDREQVILISCDLRSIRNEIRDGVRARLAETLPGIPSDRIILNATHTHSAPPLGNFRIELDGMTEDEYQAFAIPRIAAAAEKAWNNRKPGGISYGLSYAVVGRNRLIAYMSGNSSMYGNTDRRDFSHVEGYEDPSVNLLYTWSAEGELTGIVINLAAPSQVSRSATQLSADYWHETRELLRQRTGNENLFILPQCSAAGDKDTNVLWDKRADARMLRLTGRNRRQEIAERLATATLSIKDVMRDNIEWAPALAHHSETLRLPRRKLGVEDVEKALDAARPHAETFEKMQAELAENPELKNDPAWLRKITTAGWRARRGQRVEDRYKLQLNDPYYPVEAHIIRIGDIVIATNPFELYLDFGIRIKAQSTPAIQTFIVQLAGSGSYVPTERSVAGGAYGAVPASTQIGPDGGQALVTWTVEAIQAVWAKTLQTKIEGGLELPTRMWIGSRIFDNYRGLPPMAVVRRKSSPAPQIRCYFDLETEPQGKTELHLQGMDNEKEENAEITISVNDTTIFEGPVPFPKDDRSNPAAPWAWHSFEIPRGVLRKGQNLVVIKNTLDDGDDEEKADDYNWGWCMIGKARILTK